MKILVLNSGSSSQKSALFEMGPDSAADPVPPLWQAKLEWDGSQEKLSIRTAQGQEFVDHHEIPAPATRPSLERMLEKLWSGPTAAIRDECEVAVVGHRIVHGGAKLARSVLIDAGVKQAIRDVSEIAPLHNRAGLEGIELAGRLFPGRPQVAVFDTSFHRTLPPAAAVYPGPYPWYERGIRRYGFHGINHQYCAWRAARLLDRELSSLRTVTCHLGNGCSLAAVDGGKSIDTTMGFTPLEGLMMGTRSGSIDAGILLHLMRTDRMTAENLDDLLNHRSGLLGISGISADMRLVLAAMGKGSERARLAFDIFLHRLRSAIAGMTASLGGMDVLVFTAGIGENSPEVRLAACEGLHFLGIRVDEARNAKGQPDLDVSSPESRVRILVIGAQEDWAIAEQCARLAQPVARS